MIVSAVNNFNKLFISYKGIQYITDEDVPLAILIEKSPNVLKFVAGAIGLSIRNAATDYVIKYAESRKSIEDARKKDIPSSEKILGSLSDFTAEFGTYKTTIVVNNRTYQIDRPFNETDSRFHYGIITQPESGKIKLYSLFSKNTTHTFTMAETSFTLEHKNIESILNKKRVEMWYSQIISKIYANNTTFLTQARNEGLLDANLDKFIEFAKLAGMDKSEKLLVDYKTKQQEKEMSKVD